MSDVVLCVNRLFALSICLSLRSIWYSVLGRRDHIVSDSIDLLRISVDSQRVHTDVRAIDSVHSVEKASLHFLVGSLEVPGVYPVALFELSHNYFDRK